MNVASPNEWNIGDGQKTMSSRWYGTRSMMLPRFFRPAAAESRAAPLGVPVVPDVWITILADPASRVNGDGGAADCAARSAS